MRSMDSILSDEPSVHSLPEAAESDSPPEASSGAEVETSEGATPEPDKKIEAGTKPPAKGDDADDGDPDPADYSIAGLRKAVTASRRDKREERQKRQEAERRIKQLEEQLAARSQVAARPSDQPKPEDREDLFYKNPVAHLEQIERRLVESFEQGQFRERANISEWHVRQKHEDYEDAKGAFLEAARKSPYLWQQVRESEFPAEVVYQEGKKFLGGGVPLEAQTRIKQLEEELAAAKGGSSQGATSKAPVKPIPPKSIAGARGSGASVKPAWSGPRSLNEILG